jgi:hypothetical protein
LDLPGIARALYRLTAEVWSVTGWNEQDALDIYLPFLSVLIIHVDTSSAFIAVLDLKITIFKKVKGYVPP